MTGSGVCALSEFDCHLLGEGFACCALLAPQALKS